MKAIKCVDCDCDESDFNKLYFGMRGAAHIRWPDCVAAAIARAEAAERRVAELEALLTDEWRLVTGSLVEFLDVERYELRETATFIRAPGKMFFDMVEYSKRSEWRPLPDLPTTPPPAATE